MKRTESGSAASSLLIVVLAVVAVGSLAFGFWAFSGYKDYKDKSDQKSAAAASVAADAARKDQIAKDAEAAKAPYKTFSGTPTFGTITFSYPKTWSSYVDTTNASEPINGYFNPGDVPGVSSGSAFALRAELTSNAYNNVVQQFESQANQGTVTATAYVPPKMKGVTNAQTGTMLVGQVGQSSGGSALNGAMLIIPVRDKTLQLYTLSNNYLSDFNNIVMASLTYTP